MVWARASRLCALVAPAPAFSSRTRQHQKRTPKPPPPKKNNPIHSVGQGNLCIVHVSLVPVIGVVGEQKTKPTQHSVAVLRSLGLHPHLLACRCAEPLDEGVRSKLALFCQVPTQNVLTMHDVSNLWRVPLLMQEQGAHETVCRVLGLGEAVSGRLDMRRWKADIADRWDALKEPVRIALIGKYTGLSDAYLSVVKSLQHACLAANLRLVLDWVDAAHLEPVSAGGGGGNGGGSAAAGGGSGGGSDGGNNNATSAADKHAAAWATVRAADGVLVPGGFGTRGTEGKILAARYARENKVPFLGICLGMQVAVIEFARSVLGIADADSAEFNPATAHPAVVFMPEISTEHMGGTMRLGARRTVLQTMQCATAKLYQRERDVYERHRHRYEVNPALVPRLEAEGLRFVGKDETGERMEILELEDNPSGHPFYVAAQFHPEFKTRPGKPTPLFLGFVLAAGKKLDAYLQARATPAASAQPTPTKAAGAGGGAPAASAVAKRLEGAALADGTTAGQQ